MQSDKITNGSGALLCALAVMTNGYSVLPGMSAGSNAWIASAIATVAASVSAFFIAYICDKGDDGTFYGGMSKGIGAVGAKLAGAFFLILTLVTCTVSLTVFSRFVQFTALSRTPQIILPLLTGIICALACRGGLYAPSGAGRLLFWFSAGVFVFFTASALFEEMPFSYMKNAEDAKKTFSGAAEVYLNRFLLIPALGAVYSRMSERKTRRKYFVGAVSLSGAALCVISAICIATLGAESASYDFYPVYTAMSVRSIGGFVQHTEILSCIAMTVSLFSKVSVGLVFLRDMISGIFGQKFGGAINLPIALISVACTQLIYRDISTLRTMLEWRWGASVVLVLSLGIPIVLAIFLKLRRRDNHLNGRSA